MSFSINSALNQNGCTENEGDQIKIYFEKMDEKNRQTAASNPRRFESSIPTPLTARGSSAKTRQTAAVNSLGRQIGAAHGEFFRRSSQCSAGRLAVACANGELGTVTGQDTA